MQWGNRNWAGSPRTARELAPRFSLVPLPRLALSQIPKHARLICAFQERCLFSTSRPWPWPFSLV